MTLEPYEEEIMFQMYDHQIIGNDYLPTQIVAAMIKWSTISQKYSVKKKFPHVLRRLIKKGYINDHGKRGKVASLTKRGVLYVVGKK